MSRTDPAPLPAVLIVEDDPTIGHHLHLGLQGHGYPTTGCRTGAAALSTSPKPNPESFLHEMPNSSLMLSSLDTTALRARLRLLHTAGGVTGTRLTFGALYLLVHGV